MSKQVKIQKTVFNKAAFNETVNTEFTQLVTTPDPSFFDINLATQNDFWILYEKFFYEIPKDGEINSHEYLAKTSGEYASYEPQAEEIQALLEEIAELRTENLEVRQEIADVVQQFQQQQNAAEEAASQADG
jgi:serine phosphatase RsbU (regulator of sigma subunit)